MRLWGIRLRLRRMWLGLCGLTGEFEEPEDSERNRALTRAWERSWPDTEPIGHLLRETYPDRWVRFHNLPQSKRYADTDQERAEILSRQRSLLTGLLGANEPARLTAIAVDWDANDLATGRSRRHLPGAWPWRRVDDADSDAGQSYLWVRTSLSSNELDALLTAIAADRAQALLTDPALTWLFCPYDGGVDVILPNTAARDALRDRHLDWLSPHHSGL